MILERILYFYPSEKQSNRLLEFKDFPFGRHLKKLWRFPFDFFKNSIKNDRVLKKLCQKLSFRYHLIFGKQPFIKDGVGVTEPKKKGQCRA